MTNFLYIGMVKKKLDPLSGSPAAQILPPCRSTMRLQIARPIPVPGYLPRPCKPLENQEHLVLVLLLETDAVVLRRERATARWSWPDRNVDLEAAGRGSGT